MTRYNNYTLTVISHIGGYLTCLCVWSPSKGELRKMESYLLSMLYYQGMWAQNQTSVQK